MTPVPLLGFANHLSDPRQQSCLKRVNIGAVTFSGKPIRLRETRKLGIRGRLIHFAQEQRLACTRVYDKVRK